MNRSTLRTTVLSLLLALGTAPALADRHAGIDRVGMDPGVRVQDDLYRAANGGWLKTTAIPADRAEVFGVDLPGRVQARVQELVSELQRQQQAPGSAGQRVADYVKAFRDTEAIDRAGLAPLRPLLAGIDRIRTRRDLAQWQGHAQGRLQTPIYLWGGFADFQDPTLNRVLAWQGGLGLPNRDFYLRLDDAAMAKAREAYLAYLETLARAARLREPAETATQVLRLETRLAQAQVRAEDERNPALMANPRTADELMREAPGLDWHAFLAAAGIPSGHKVTVAQLPAAKAMAALHAELPLAHWQAYLTLRSLDEAAPVLPAAFRVAHFAFHGRALAGLEAPAPRAQLAIDRVSADLGDALSRLYVERHFPSGHRERVRGMVTQLLAAFREQIETNPHLSLATRRAALEKLSHYGAKVGHPDQWRDDRGLQIRAHDALGNRQRSQQHAWARLAAQSGQRMDRNAWMMSPLTVNAFYDPQLNEINLPAGILQAPLFDIEADDAVNYGGIGAQIGHEISHGFDHLGSQFDAQGAMRPWVAEADQRGLQERAQTLVAQYGRYEALPGRPLNGSLTLPENTADVIGLQVAFRAYQRSLGGRPSPQVNGWSGEQRFFMAYAQSWRIQQREERILQLMSDPHAPHEFRTNGVVQHVDGFHEAFGTQPGDRLYRPAGERVRLW